MVSGRKIFDEIDSIKECKICGQFGLDQIHIGDENLDAKCNHCLEKEEIKFYKGIAEREVYGA